MQGKISLVFSKMRPYNADIESRGETKMTTFDTTIHVEETIPADYTVETVSDCCYITMDSAQADYGVCPRCGEHCEVITL
jgi:hypothetical protein